MYAILESKECMEISLQTDKFFVYFSWFPESFLMILHSLPHFASITLRRQQIAGYYFSPSKMHRLDKVPSSKLSSSPDNLPLIRTLTSICLSWATVLKRFFIGGKAVYNYHFYDKNSFLVISRNNSIQLKLNWTSICLSWGTVLQRPFIRGN